MKQTIFYSLFVKFLKKKGHIFEKNQCPTLLSNYSCLLNWFLKLLNMEPHSTWEYLSFYWPIFVRVERTPIPILNLNNSFLLNKRNMFLMICNTLKLTYLVALSRSVKTVSTGSLLALNIMKSSSAWQTPYPLFKILKPKSWARYYRT